MMYKVSYFKLEDWKRTCYYEVCVCTGRYAQAHLYKLFV